VESVSRSCVLPPVAREVTDERIGLTTTIYTVGHSTRSLDEFIALLTSFAIETVVDVRTIARSRHNPQYNETELDQGLADAGIAYMRMKGLGGLRHPTKASINQAWKNRSFRGYADYMQTPEFAENLERLMRVADTARTVIMCAEAVPWRCHRSLIGDALVTRGVSVEDLITVGNSKAHRLTSFAYVDGDVITYPATVTD
jgi:uncharacterized protein (DUF488 family)